MATNWGIVVPLGAAIGVNWTRAMSGVLPDTADMVLDSVSIYVAAHSAQVRVAIYEGGSAANPAGASLLEDLGETTGSTTAWLVLTSVTKPALSAEGRIWIAVKGNDDAFDVVYSTSSGDAGDFRSDVGRWQETDIPNDETVAYPDTWPANTGDFGAAWYSFYLTYSVSGGGIVVLRRRRM